MNARQSGPDQRRPGVRGAHALLAAWRVTVRREASRIALIEGASGARCSFDELERRSARWGAAHLPAPAEIRGRPVVFAVPNGIAWFEILLGLFRAGAVPVPLDASEPPAEQRRVAEAIGAAWLWSGGALAPVGGKKRFRDAQAAWVKLTSGSTGAPKPLVFTGPQLLADARQVTRSMGIKRQDVNYALIPLGHSYGLGNLTLPLLAHGVPLVCGSAPLPHAIAADFAAYRPTVFPGVPPVWRALSVADLDRSGLASLRLAISAGAPLPAGVAQGFETKFGIRLHNFYGSSETGGIAFDRTGAATLAGGVGRALAGVELQWRRGGRLFVRSAAVFTHGNRRRSGRYGGWVPPDRVGVAPGGGLTLLGRTGTIVKVAGRRLDPAEITTRLRQLRGVLDAWVGVSDAAEPVLGAVLSTRRPVAEVRAELHAALPAWKIPKQWAVVEQLPATARGKIDVRTLRALVFR